MKKILMLLVVMFGMVVFTACANDSEADQPENQEDVLDEETEEEQEEVALTTLTITGMENKSVKVGQTLNVLEGITVTGDNGVDYTDYLMIKSSNCGFDHDNNLYTQTAKKCDISYIAVAEGYYVREDITITITN